MGRFEVSCRRFAVKSSVNQEAGDYSLCVHPRLMSFERRGTLAMLTEPAGDHPSLATEACRLVQSAIVQHYFADTSVSLTSSLLNALESANNALLQYNYNEISRQHAQAGSVAVQVGGAKTRRARVGLTTVLVRPDGTGLYISQMAPTQCYLMHSGILSAIPEPPGWSGPAGRLVVPLRRVSSSEDSDEEVDSATLPAALPSVPLGSSASIEADLIYRRIAPGDLVVMVSSSLARHLDRASAEEIFASGNPDAISDALYAIAEEQGLAEAHACVLELGTERSEGVETEIAGHVEDYRQMPVLTPEETMANGGARSQPHNVLPVELPHIKVPFKGPREWLARRRASEGIADEQDEIEHASTALEQEYAPLDEAISLEPTLQPTEALTHQSLDVPPYKASKERSESKRVEELDFDGWEDAPPALDISRYGPRERLTFRPRALTLNEPLDSEPAEAAQPTIHHATRSYMPPALFNEADFADEEEYADKTDVMPEKATPHNWIAVGERGITSLKNIISGFLPDHPGEASEGTRRMVLPVRLVIGLALVALLAVFAFSLLSLDKGQKQQVVSGLLAQAKQEDLLANQPGATDVERQQRLRIALDKAKQALVENPQSLETQTALNKVQGELDTAEGVTRLINPTPIFDLTDADKGVSTTPQPVPQPVNVSTAVSGTNAAQTNSILVQSNDAYVLDRKAGKIYRCRISAQNCTVVLSSGDTAGGQKVGTLISMTLRVGSLVALDKNLVAYVYNADTSAWQAQPLGDANKLAEPKEIASYDGNLYLLGAKPGQVSKYQSGQYADSPKDWITDPAASDAMQNPVSMAIDGVIYVLKSDGKVLVMQAGKIDRTITLKSSSTEAAPTQLFTSADTPDLYILRAADGSITRVTKEGQPVAKLKAPVTATELGTLSGMTVDEGRGKIYLLSGRRVYQANLPGIAAPSNNALPSPTNPTTTGSTPLQPAPQPTAAP